MLEPAPPRQFERISSAHRSQMFDAATSNVTLTQDVTATQSALPLKTCGTSSKLVRRPLTVLFMIALTCAISGVAVVGQDLGVAKRSDGDKTDPLRVGSFNIRYNNRGDGEDAWPNRKQFVADVILESDADIVGLQEALHGQIEDLESLLPDHAWFGVGRDDGKEGGEFVPIFYRRDRFEVISKGHFWLSETPDQPGSRSWDAAITRMVSWMILKDKKSQREFLFANTHFDHRGSEARKESARMIREMLPKLAGKRPAILSGDFNCLATDEPYATMTAKDEEGRMRWADARSICEAKPQGPDSTWCGFRKVEPGRRIDFVFVSPQISVLQHVIVDRTFDGKFPSDHLPVFVTLQLPDQEK